MKKIVLPLVLLGLLAGNAQAQVKKGQKAAAGKAKTEAAAMKSLALGSPIPMGGMMLQSVTGEPKSLESAKTDKGLLVMFSCNTCPFVIKAQTQTTRALERAAGSGLGVMIVNSNQAQREDQDSPDQMRQYATQHHYTVPYVLDENSQIANAFGATRTPEVFLFDSDGKLVYKGALEDNPADPEKSTKFYLLNAMEAMVKKQPITPAETKSIGCSIKRLES